MLSLLDPEFTRFSKKERGMKNAHKRYLKSLALASCAAVLMTGLNAGEASATNGYFAHGYSMQSKAMAGAGVALPLDSLAAASNPAGMAVVGDRLDLGLSVFNPNREYRVLTAGAGVLALGEVESDSTVFVIPMLGVNWMVGESTSLGFAAYGNGGMNTDYPVATFNGMGGSSRPTGVDLSQLFVSATLAHKFADMISIGISPIFAYQKFEALGAQPFTAMSAFPSKVTNNGHDNSMGFGGRVGILAEFVPAFSVGLSYQSKIFMSEFENYKGFFADGGDFDIPADFTGGFVVKPHETFAIAFDVQHIFYSDIDSVGNRNTLPTSGVLGSSTGSGFGWEDVTVFKIGIQWDASEDWTWRAGYSHADQPIQSTEMLFNMLAPAVVEDHITLGFTKRFGESHELHFALMHALDNTVSGSTPAGLTGLPQVVELSMNQWEASIGYSWKF